ncbi:MAG: hypothetical protein RL612_24 [Actinomycetota bacterium]|jgi:hypothetical protein
MNQEELLASRYGKKTRNKQRDRLAIIGIAVLALVLFLTWAISVTAANSGKPTGNLLSYTVVSDSEVTVEISANNRSGREVICQVEALANDYEVIGYKEIPITAGATSVTSNLKTVKPAVSAVVKDCWFK